MRDYDDLSAFPRPQTASGNPLILDATTRRHVRRRVDANVLGRRTLQGRWIRSRGDGTRRGTSSSEPASSSDALPSEALRSAAPRPSTLAATPADGGVFGSGVDATALGLGLAALALAVLLIAAFLWNRRLSNTAASAPVSPSLFAEGQGKGGSASRNDSKPGSNERHQRGVVGASMRQLMYKQAPRKKKRPSDTGQRSASMRQLTYKQTSRKKKQLNDTGQRSESIAREGASPLHDAVDGDGRSDGVGAGSASSALSELGKTRAEAMGAVPAAASLLTVDSEKTGTDPQELASVTDGGGDLSPPGSSQQSKVDDADNEGDDSGGHHRIAQRRVTDESSHPGSIEVESQRRRRREMDELLHRPTVKRPASDVALLLADDDGGRDDNGARGHPQKRRRPHLTKDVSGSGTSLGSDGGGVPVGPYVPLCSTASYGGSSSSLSCLSRLGSSGSSSCWVSGAPGGGSGSRPFGGISEPAQERFVTSSDVGSVGINARPAGDEEAAERARWQPKSHLFLEGNRLRPNDNKYGGSDGELMLAARAEESYPWSYTVFESASLAGSLNLAGTTRDTFQLRSSLESCPSLKIIEEGRANVILEGLEGAERKSEADACRTSSLWSKSTREWHEDMIQLPFKFDPHSKSGCSNACEAVPETTRGRMLNTLSPLLLSSGGKEEVVATDKERKEDQGDVPDLRTVVSLSKDEDAIHVEKSEYFQETGEASGDTYLSQSDEVAAYPLQSAREVPVEFLPHGKKMFVIAPTLASIRGAAAAEAAAIDRMGCDNLPTAQLTGSLSSEEKRYSDSDNDQCAKSETTCHRIFQGSSLGGSGINDHGTAYVQPFLFERYTARINAGEGAGLDTDSDILLTVPMTAAERRAMRAEEDALLHGEEKSVLTSTRLEDFASNWEDESLHEEVRSILVATQLEEFIMTLDSMNDEEWEVEARQRMLNVRRKVTENQDMLNEILMDAQ